MHRWGWSICSLLALVLALGLPQPTHAATAAGFCSLSAYPPTHNGTAIFGHVSIVCSVPAYGNVGIKLQANRYVGYYDLTPWLYIDMGGATNRDLTISTTSGTRNARTVGSYNGVTVYSATSYW